VCALGGDGGAVDAEVVAAGAAEPGDVPRVLDDHLVAGEQRHAQLRDAVDDSLDAVAEQPVGMLATAGEGPPAGHAISTVDRLDRSGRVDRAGDHDVGPVGVQRVERRSREAGEVDPGAGTDHHRPPRRAVRRGERLEHLQRRSKISADAAVARRQQQSEGTSALELLDEVGRQPSGRLDLGGASGDARRHVTHRGEDVPGGGRGVLERSHAAGSDGRNIGASAACRARSSSSQPPLQ
jgi:hypothetical protein